VRAANKAVASCIVNKAGASKAIAGISIAVAMANREERVTDIAKNDAALEVKAGQMCDEDVKLDSDEAVVSDLGEVPEEVVAVLIKLHGGNGALRAFTQPLINVVTGPEKSRGYIIVNVSGLDTRIFGSPSLRYFRRR